jgi:hypothetical protein
MKLRTPPGSVRYERDPLWERTNESRRLVQMVLDDPSVKLPSHLTDAQCVAIEAEAASRRYGIFSRGEYRGAIERGMDDTRRYIVAPVSDTPTEDVSNAWRQPEGREFVRRLMAEVHANRSTMPSLFFAFGVMLAVGALRATPHIRHGHDLLVNNPALFGLVSDLALSCEGPARCEPAATSYTQVTRHMRRLSEGMAAEGHITLAQIGSQFLNWGIPFGLHLAVDGSLVPAWAPQRSAYVNGEFDPALEDHLRRRTPEARFIVYSRDYEEDRRSEKPQRLEGAVRRRASGPRVRGYRLTCAVDVATGITQAFDLREATSHEPKTLRDVLLPVIFGLSPELNVNAVVADAKYDDDQTHGHLETHYGIHLVASRKGHAFENRGRLFKDVTHPSVAALRGDGIAICREHGSLLEYKGLDAPRREGLRPGEPTNPAAFRSRFFCADGCGKVSIATQSRWSNAPYYPYTPHGRLKLYARRRALLRRREQVEALFAALQVGYKQCLDGAARVRVYDRGVQEGFLTLSIVTRDLLTLLAERTRRGEVA